MTRQNITDILCIGCQKGSTSWLHSVLNTHPDTWAFPDSEPLTSTDKEAHFWDWNHHRGAEWYRALLAPPDPALRTMDFTPEYAFLDDTQIAECKALNPTAKVLYILRDPLARAVSTIRMYMLWVLGKGHDRPLRLDDTFYGFVREARLDRHGDYLRNLRAWQRQYPDLIVLNYEDFHTDRQASVEALLHRLGLEPAAITGPRREAFDRLMGGRVWASEPFALERPVLMFLEGLTWRFRLQAEAELGLTFAEGQRLLDGG